MNNNKKVVLVFGTFNPVTNAHIELGKHINNIIDSADIIYVLSNSNFMSKWKNMDNFLSDKERTDLLINAVKPYGFGVSTLEIDGVVDSRTYNTVEYYKEYYDEIYICFGMDKMTEIDKWYKAEELIANNKFIIFTRENKTLDSIESPLILKYINNFNEINLPDKYQFISSTSIRNAFKAGKIDDYKDHIPENVYKFLKGDKKMSFDAEKVSENLISWLQDWFDKNGKGCNAIIGISGGKDSSVAAALCVKALGKDRVIGVLMPNHIQDDIEDSKLLVSHLGIKHYIIDIGPSYDAMMNSISERTDLSEITPQTKQNLPPRLRMTTLYAISQSLNGRVINTCNLSEDWVGYSTKYGDAAGDVSPFANLTVQEVKALGRHWGLPAQLVDKAPSDGLCGKTDEDNLGFTYATLDKYIRTGICEDEETKKLIDLKHERNLFKLLPMEYFHYNP